MEKDLKENNVATKPDEKKKEPAETRQASPPSSGLPEDVMCDSCIETPCKASKSCLTCMVSYCDDHLRPHLENAKFQSHKLVEPLMDMEQRVCQVHQLDLQLYCMKDGCCVCPSCETEEHKGHNIAPLGEARQHIEV